MLAIVPVGCVTRTGEGGKHFFGGGRVAVGSHVAENKEGQEDGDALHLVSPRSPAESTPSFFPPPPVFRHQVRPLHAALEYCLAADTIKRPVPLEKNSSSSSVVVCDVAFSQSHSRTF